MNHREINKYPIATYLRKIGINPSKEHSCYKMYHSPFREDRTPSFKVGNENNRWHDFGTGESGSLIDLVMKIENCTVGHAMQILEEHICINDSFPFQKGNIPTQIASKAPIIRIDEIKPITHPALLQYLNKRIISSVLSDMYCKEVHYSKNDKNYFAIGFKNDSNGWNLRNEYFKGCTYMDISTVRAIDKSVCILFEGFMDFLSYLTMKEEKELKHDIIVLNSIVNLPKAMKKLSEYKKIQAFLDNDNGGRQAIQYLTSNCKEVIDQSVHYQNFKDLNEYHIAKQIGKRQQVKPKTTRGLKV